MEFWSGDALSYLVSSTLAQSKWSMERDCDAEFEKNARNSADIFSNIFFSFYFHLSSNA